jgi:sodium--glutamate symport carrier gltS
MGLIIASLMGGLITKFPLRRYRLKGEHTEKPMVGISYEKEDSKKINHFSIMGVILTLHLAIILAYLLHTAVLASGFMLPLYVPCLRSATVLSNTVLFLMPKMNSAPASGVLCRCDELFRHSVCPKMAGALNIMKPSRFWDAMGFPKHRAAFRRPA